MLNAHDILETITMIQEENLDIRTITMGISLLDCCDSDLDRTCEQVYDKITRQARDLVKTGEQIEKEYGIPIINKRISVTPIAMIAAACDRKEPVRLRADPGARRPNLRRQLHRGLFRPGAEGLFRRLTRS